MALSAQVSARSSQLLAQSGRRDSNPLPTAWEAVALPGELLPQGRSNLLNIRLTATISQGIGI